MIKYGGITAPLRLFQELKAFYIRKVKQWLHIEMCLYQAREHIFLTFINVLISNKPEDDLVPTLKAENYNCDFNWQ